MELTLKAFKTQKGKDGLISKAKFIQVMAEHGAADEEFAAAIFESFDRDGNGCVPSHRCCLKVVTVSSTRLSLNCRCIDVHEYLALMGVTFGGSVEEKLEGSTPPSLHHCSCGALDTT